MSTSAAPNALAPELCYVLKTFAYRERDLIAVLLSEKRGKFSAVARNGVQSRRFGGSLDLFSCSEFQFDPKTIRIAEMNEEGLVQALSAQVKHAPTLGSSFERLSAGSALNELILKAVPAQRASSDLFKLYSNALFALQERDPAQSIMIVNAFILKVTQWLGVQPQLTRCLHCEKALNEVSGDDVAAMIDKGAWICRDCLSERTPNRLTKTAILDAYHSMLHPIRRIEFAGTYADHDGLLDFLEKHMQYFVPGLDRTPLGSLKFLRESLQSPF